MARFKSHLFVLIGFVLLGAIGAAFGNGTAQAIVAAQVQVANTTANPVPTNAVDVTDPGRIGYQATINNAGKCSGTECLFSFPTVPSGHRVVVQHISGAVGFTGPPIDVLILTAIVPNQGNIEGFAAPTLPTLPVTTFDQPVLFYVDAGSAVVAQVAASGNIVFSANTIQFVTLTGYELDCTVAPARRLRPNS
jgi:hypothetical protein